MIRVSTRLRIARSTRSVNRSTIPRLIIAYPCWSVRTGHWLGVSFMPAAYVLSGSCWPGYSRSLRGYENDGSEGVIRWHSRVAGDALTLTTDEYPPFRLRSGPARPGSLPRSGDPLPVREPDSRQPGPRGQPFPEA